MSGSAVLFDDAHGRFDGSNGSASVPAFASSKPNRILIVLHQENSTPGRIGRLLKEQGFSLDIRRPRFGDQLPSSLDNHAGTIIFGGPMSCNDNESWIKREIDWIGVPLRDQKPFLGICLGAQMLARHLGERVGPHPDGKVEAGYYPISPTAAGQQLWPLLPCKVYQWHREGLNLPTGATLLAKGDDFLAQAFRFGSRAFGLQFHPEVTYQMMCRWTTGGADRLTMPGALPRERHFRDWFIHDGKVATWLECFLRDWASGRSNSSALAPMKAQPRFA